MNLLPYDRFSVQTTRPLAAIINLLSEQVEAPRLRWGFQRNGARYTGTIADTGFTIRRIIHYRNSFLPQIQGRFESLPQGTVVHITMQLHPLVLAFMLFWLVSWYGILILMVTSGVLTGDIAPEMIWGFGGAPIVLHLAFFAAFWLEARHSRRELTQILQGEPLPVSSSRLAWQILRGIASVIVVANIVVLLHQHILAPEAITPLSNTALSQASPTCAQNLSASPFCNFALAHTLTAHPEATQIAFSGDGSALVSGGSDKAIKVWDTQTGALQQTLQSDSGVVTALATSPDGQAIVSGGGDRLVRIWNTTLNQSPQLLRGHTAQSIERVKLLADGKTLASSGYGEIKFWDAATGELQATFPENDATEVTLGPVTISSGPSRFRLHDISADGTQFLIQRGERLTIWNRATNEQQTLPHQWFTYVNAARMSPDGQTVVTTSYTQPKTHLKIWDVATGKIKTKVLLSNNREHWGYGDRMTVTQEHVLTSTPNNLTVWNLQTGELEAVLETGANYRPVVSSDRQQIAVIGDSSEVGSRIEIWQR
ncbi:MAG: hypothetical protein AAFX01_00070 [Cyanobacteria bacterium J06638_28]